MNKCYKLRITNYKLRIIKILCVLCVLCGGIFSVKAQSTSQNFPTPVASNEINGKIVARDIGDARLTSYFYVFNGNQGDVFINVVTRNFDGDIDVFTVEGLRPMTKIRAYSDAADGETGRIVYLRQPTRLLLRIEGRTPNDEPATFRIKFAGSFEPLKAVAETEEEKLPEIKTENEGEVRVNSVGTIIEVKPKKKETEVAKEETETIAETKKETVKEKKSGLKKDEVAEKSEKPIKEEKEEAAPVVVITDTLPKKEEKKIEKKEETVSETEAKPKKTTKKEKTTEPNPLESINLVVLFKDGTKIERPMSEVLRVNVDNKGMLTIVLKDGTISRYSILDVDEMKIK